MRSYVGAVILLATVANLMTLHTVECSANCKVNLKQVVENCYGRNQATCKNIISHLKALKSNIVGSNKDVLSYFACLNVDSGIMVPNKPFNLDNLHRWYAKVDWPAIDPIATQCSSGANEKITNGGDRIFKFLKCVHADKNHKTLTPTTSFLPAACQ